MTTQEFADYISQFSSLSKEDLIDLLLTDIKMKMREQKTTTERFVFSGSIYIIEAPENELQ